MSLLSNIFGSKENELPDFSGYTNTNQITHIFGYLSSSDQFLAKKAASKINDIFRNDKEFSKKEVYNMFKYLQIKVSDFKKFKTFPPEEAETIYCLASLNHSGYVRQKAIEMLEQSPTPFSFKYVIYRCGDWVQNVRKSALNTFENYLSNDHNITLIENHDLIEWLLKVQRVDLGQLVERIESIAFSSTQIDSTLSLSDSLNESSRLFLFKGLIKRNQIDNEVKSKMVNDKYYLIRLLLTDQLSNEDSAILDQLLFDKSSKVRLRAIQIARNINYTINEQNLELLACDSSAGVREIARKQLSTKKIDFREFYLEKLSLSLSYGALLGLREFITSKDEDILIDILRNESAKIRAVALFSMLKVNPPLAKDKALTGIASFTIKEKKVAVAILKEIGSSSDLPFLRKEFGQADMISQKFILRIINDISGWGVIGDFIKCLEIKELRPLAYSYIDAWNSYTIRLATTPKEQEVQYALLMKNQLNKNEIDLPRNIEGIINQLEFILSQS